MDNNNVGRGKRGDRIAVKKKTGTDTDTTEDEKKFVSGSATKKVSFSQPHRREETDWPCKS